MPRTAGLHHPGAGAAPYTAPVHFSLRCTPDPRSTDAPGERFDTDSGRATVGMTCRPTTARAPYRRRPLPLAALVPVLLLGLGGCAQPAGTDGPASAQQLAQQLEAEPGSGTGESTVAGASGTGDEAALARNALSVLDGIPIAGKTDWDGPFDRAGSFGDGWQDPDGNGCDARNDALAEAFTEVQLLRDGCRVASGVFTDPYSGQTVEFLRGPDTSDDVQVDHVVALYNAWRTGAQDLDFDERVQLANDPLNLQPTLDWVNDDKQSQDASQWLPPEEDYHCVYVARQVAVKASYGLWVTPAEHETINEVLQTCAAG